MKIRIYNIPQKKEIVADLSISNVKKLLKTGINNQNLMLEHRTWPNKHLCLLSKIDKIPVLTIMLLK